MEIRKTIKVFLASSEELKDERDKFGNLIRRLDDRYLKRGIHVQLICWEDLDPCCYENVRKQDEYNAMIRQCDIFVCLFYTKAGQYTREELEVARQENERRKEPQIMIYLRDLQPDDVEQPDLVEFKQTLEHELHHFWGHYPTTDKLHLDFVMFLLNREGDSDVVQVENGDVMFDGLPIASMDNLPFASENAGYKQMKAELEELSDEIGLLESMVDSRPNKQKYQEKLGKKRKRYNALKDQFSELQKNLFDTAKRISEMQLMHACDELKRAAGEFEAGHVELANMILDDIEREGDRHIGQLDRDRELIHQDIEALLLKTKTLMVDARSPIEKRIKQTWDTYKKADDWAERSALSKEKYAALLHEYGLFLRNNAKYEAALKVLIRASHMCEELYGMEGYNTGASYDNLGGIYSCLGKYDKALDYHRKALNILLKCCGEESMDIASPYNNIGSALFCMGKYDLALDNYKKALHIYEQVLGMIHPQTAGAYYNIGNVCFRHEKYKEALMYYQKSLDIRLKVSGTDQAEIAMSYGSIGDVHDNLGNKELALKYNQKALEICLKVLGREHIFTSLCYGNIGLIYNKKGEYELALENDQKALEICLIVLGPNHPDTAMCYFNIGCVYHSRREYDRALEFHQKALEIFKQTSNAKHPYRKIVENTIDDVRWAIVKQNQPAYSKYVYFVMNLAMTALLVYAIYYLITRYIQQ